MLGTIFVRWRRKHYLEFWILLLFLMIFVIAFSFWSFLHIVGLMWREPILDVELLTRGMCLCNIPLSKFSSVL